MKTLGKVIPPTRVNIPIVTTPFECNRALSCPGLKVTLPVKFLLVNSGYRLLGQTFLLINSPKLVNYFRHLFEKCALECCSPKCRKVTGFSSVRYVIGLNKLAPFFHPIRIKALTVHLHRVSLDLKKIFTNIGGKVSQN